METEEKDDALLEDEELEGDEISEDDDEDDLGELDDEEIDADEFEGDETGVVDEEEGFEEDEAYVGFDSYEDVDE